jgi:hypothetical protein
MVGVTIFVHVKQWAGGVGRFEIRGERGEVGWVRDGCQVERWTCRG